MITEEVKFVGKITNVYFKGGNDFLIGSIQTDDENNKKVTFKGNMYGVRKGENIIIGGKWEYNNKYGQQLVVHSWERPIPKTKDQIISFLSSRLVKGCGPKTAILIANKLGDDALKIITEKGEGSLTGIKGIGKKTANNIVESVRSTFAIQEIVSKLSNFGVNAEIAIKLYRKFDLQTMDVVTKNPYKIAEIDGFGFLKTDEIARRMGVPATSRHRIDACVEYVLRKMCYDRGHSYVLEDDLLDETLKALNHNSSEKDIITMGELFQSLMSLDGQKIVIEGNCVYPKNIFLYENELARKLSYINSKRDGEAMPKIEKWLKKHQMKHGIVLAEKQREAVRRLFSDKLLLLTGGPGTGKTTVIKTMIEAYKNFYGKKHITLVAPTGRASRKLSEVTGMEASTIHKLLGYKKGLNKPEYNQDNKLRCDLLVIDEMSMVDVQLAYNLFSALENDVHVLIVGDPDQLPSVGVGNVLSDLIKSGLPTVRLTEIFRQEKNSQIIENAHRVNNGEHLIIDQTEHDFYFIQEYNSLAVAKYIIASAKRFIKVGYQLSEILVLSPMKKGEIGTITLNETLKEVLNPPDLKKKEWKLGSRLFREGDKIMQNVNNGTKDVYNGDIGIIEKIGKTTNKDGDLIDVLFCNFHGRKAMYEKSELKELELGYATTVHKAQGGEAPIVIMPMSTDHSVMLARNLLYTAITRANEKCVLIGTIEASARAIKNNRITIRNSRLDERVLHHCSHANRYSKKELTRY